MQIGLGTAQFGDAYGVTNRHGRLSPRRIRELLDVAYSGGARVLDTASAYGASESLLGAMMVTERNFRVVTKIPSLADSDFDPVVQAHAAFEQSLSDLRIDSVYGLLVHHARDLIIHGSRLWPRITQWKNEGRVQKVGVSVYTVEELVELDSAFELDLVQIPLNLFDQRLIKDGTLRRLKERGVEVHARSVFLQGLLLADPRHLPPGFERFFSVLSRLHCELSAQGLTPLEGALSFACSQPEVSCVIVGVTSSAELKQILGAAKNPRLLDFERYRLSDPLMLDPRLW